MNGFDFLAWGEYETGMTNHQLLAFLRDAHAHYGFWPGRALMTNNLRLNTPKGEAGWDKQIQKTLPSLIKQGFIAWSRCPADAPARGGVCRHLVLTELGSVTVDAWDKHGCRAHGRSGRACSRRELALMPGMEHAA